MVASEGRKILVASIPVAANAQITAVAAVIDLPLPAVRTLLRPSERSILSSMIAKLRCVACLSFADG